MVIVKKETVYIGEAAKQGAQGETGAANRNGDTRGENTRRAFERCASTLAEMGAASWRRWGEARRVLTYGFEMATDGAAGYDDILNRPEMLRAVECLINDPPEIAQVFLMPNPNPIQGGAVCDKDCREWILSTFREWFEGFYTFGGKLELGKYGVGEKWAIGQKDERGVWRWGDLSTMRFYMFPACLNLACFLLREVWADFTEKCGLPEFDELKKWLANDRAENKRYYSRMGDLYACAYSIEQYFDFNTGKSNPPKYGGGGVRATDLLLSFRDYLRGRQAANGCAPVAADRKPDAGAADRDAAARELLHGKPDGETKAGEPVAGHIGTWAKEQGATDYYVGFSVRIRGTICPLPPLNQKRGRAISELIETENEFGAVKCDIHSALGGDTSSAEYEKIAGFLERVNAGKIGKAGSNKFSGCWHIKPAPVRR